MQDWNGGIAAGTPLLTQGGPLPASELVEGELIVTGSGAVLPLLWLGRERIDATHHPRPDRIRPVRIRQGALGAGLPRHDVVLAPGHGVYLDGLLVPAGLLVNGVTILSEAPAALFTWFHVALAGHDTLVAGGIAVESFRDLPHAARTANGATAPAPAPPPLAPRTCAGAALERLRARLLDEAGAFGFTLDHVPALRLQAGSATLLPEHRPDGTWHFTLPACDGPLRLLSRTCIGQWVWPSSRDTRRLGVAVSAITLTSNGVATDVPVRDQTLAGWHAIEGDAAGTWRWTDGEALLTCPPTREADTLRIALYCTGAYWTHAAPAAGDAAGIVFLSGEPHTPGHFYRVLRPLAAARSLGLRASWMTLQDCPQRLAEIAAAATLVIWRAPIGGALDAAIGAARAAGTRVLFDLDDLMVEPGLARPEIIDAIRLNNYRPEEIRTLYAGMRATAEAADGCLATTEALAVHLRGLNRPTWVLPNGFDAAGLRRARRAVRARRLSESDGLIRIGYAGGSRTHQRDLAPVVAAVARLLRDRPEFRLVLFREPDGGLKLVETGEFPQLAGLEAQIEWRDMVDLADLPDELARFDINLAPLDTGNLFCEAKSELKFFEAALVEVCTVASPTGPFRDAIEHGRTGFLARTQAEWYAILRQLADDAPLRRRVAAAAYLDVLWRFGPERRADLLGAVLAQLQPGRDAARAFELQTRRAAVPPPPPVRLPEGEVVHLADRLGDACVTIVIPLYNYAQFIGEALDSAWHQTLAAVDLVVVDDRSTDASLEVALDWVHRHGGRFNRVVVRRNLVNSGLGLTRNAGFAAAETPFVLPLDADNRLLPHCLARCLQAMEQSPGTAFVYPRIQQFGLTTETMGTEPYTAMRLAGGNYIDAMALIAKPAWAAVGGYNHVRFGWEDFDLWCRMAEHGLWGAAVDQVLAEYRVHASSMLREVTEVRGNKRRLVADIQRRHPWLSVAGVVEVAARVRAVQKRKKDFFFEKKKQKTFVPLLGDD